MRRTWVLAGLLSLWSSVGMAASFFEKGGVLYYIRRIPLQPCSVLGQVSAKPGYNCVPDSEYGVLAQAMPAGVSVKREGKSIEIPPFATQWCALSREQLMSQSHLTEQASSQQPATEHCSGYLPFAQEAGLDEEDGRLYLFLYEHVGLPASYGQGVDPSWEAYLSRFRWPHILEIPVRGDRVLNFLQRKIQNFDQSDTSLVRNLLTQYLDWASPDENTVQTLREVIQGQSPAGSEVLRFQYQVSKSWQALHYLYGTLLTQQGIPPSDWVDLMRDVEIPSEESIRVEQFNPESGRLEKVRLYLSAPEVLIQQVVQGHWDHDIFQAPVFQQACDQGIPQNLWSSVNLSDTSPGAHQVFQGTEWGFYRFFMQAVVWPWLCETYHLARTLTGSGGGPSEEALSLTPPIVDLETAQRRMTEALDRVQKKGGDYDALLDLMQRMYPNDPFVTVVLVNKGEDLGQEIQSRSVNLDLLISRARHWMTETFSATTAEFRRQVKTNTLVLYDFVDVLRTEATLLHHRSQIEKYRPLITELQASSIEAQKLYLAPHAMGELFQSQVGVEDFSETSMDALVDQMRSAALITTREAVLRESVQEVHERLKAYLRSPAAYAKKSEALVTDILQLSEGDAVRFKFGQVPSLRVSTSETPALKSFMVPQFLRGVRSHVMQYLYDRIGMLGVHHADHQALLRHILNMEGVMRLILGGMELSVPLPSGWARLSQTPEEEQSQNEVLSQLLDHEAIQGPWSTQPLENLVSCFAAAKDPYAAGWTRTEVWTQAPACEAFQAQLERGFQKLDWVLYFYEKLLDAPTLRWLSRGKFEKEPRLGPIVVKASQGSTSFVSEQSPRYITFAQAQALRPFERRRDGKPLQNRLFPLDATWDTTAERWQALDQLYEQVSPCASDHWCHLWRPQAYQKRVNDLSRPTEIVASETGLPGMVSEVRIEQVPPGTETFAQTVNLFLGPEHPYQQAVFLFRVSSLSQSPHQQVGVLYEQTFLVYAQAGRYDMMTQISVATTQQEGERVVSRDVKFVSSPVPFSYVHLYGRSETYRVSERYGFHELMQNFVEGFYSSPEAPKFVGAEVYRKEWMPFSHQHTWSEDSQKVAITAAGVMLVLDVHTGLIFRSDGPDQMGTRYLRAGVDGQWHHHPFDTFATGQFAGVRAPKHYNLIMLGKTIVGRVGSWLWDSISNFGFRTGVEFGKFYDPVEQSYVIKRRVQFDAGDDDFVDEPTQDTDFVNVMPAIKVMPTLPFHMRYTPPGPGYGERLEKLAYERHQPLSMTTGVLELFHQPELGVLFSPSAQDVWVLSHLPVDTWKRAPERTYLSHVDLRSQQRHPHLVNVVSYEESEQIKKFPSLSEWIHHKCEDFPKDVCAQGFWKGLWLAARQTAGGEGQGFNLLDDAIREAPYFRYNPRLRQVAMGEGEAVFAVTVFPYEYERWMEALALKGGTTPTGEAAWPSRWWLSSEYITRWAEEILQGSLQDRYRQYLLYVRWQVNDGSVLPELGKPGLDIVGRRGFELGNQVWGKMVSGQSVPVPNMELIDGMVWVGGQP